jgi:hypothetical protein
MDKVIYNDGFHYLKYFRLTSIHTICCVLHEPKAIYNRSKGELESESHHHATAEVELKQLYKC